MHDVVPVENFEGFEDLPEDEEGPLLADLLFVFEEFEKIAPIAIFVDKVVVFFGFELLEVLDDVGGGADGGENLDFVADAFL